MEEEEMAAIEREVWGWKNEGKLAMRKSRCCCAVSAAIRSNMETTQRHPHEENTSVSKKAVGEKNDALSFL